MLFRVPEIDAADERVLGELERFRMDLRHHVAEPRRWLGQLRRSLIAGAIRGSNTIEGYTVGVAEAEAVAEGEEMPTAHDRQTRAAIAGYADVLTYVQQAARFEVFTYHPMLLSVLHFTMVRSELERSPGRYRLGPIWVAGSPDNPPVYLGPDAACLPDLMDELCGWLQNSDRDAPSLVRAAMAHLNLVSIHPWRDGNGRMSRCLHTLVLARELILAPEFSSIEEWLGSSPYNTAMYYAALGEAQGGSYQPNRDAHGWVRFCLRAHHLQAQLVERRLEIAAEIWQVLAGQVAAAGLGERTVAALYAGIRPGGVRRGTYARDEGLTRDQAIRDLAGLKKAGLIEEVGHGRTQHYVASGPAAQAQRSVRGAHADRPLRDPYGDRQD
ncbi:MULTISPECIES: Fic family protein [unclassified Frankia]|uniref:Fic family protein n=1 Tax=unclassified Frankia TaxID=2632575 RepID=UPI002AD293DE|nr:MULTISPECIES: Fic family protein [unclassified Frankia]